VSHRRAKKERQNAVIATTTGLPETTCPECGSKFDAATGASIGSIGGGIPDRPVPKPGDPSICRYCASLLIFDSLMHPRRPTPELEQRILAKNPWLVQVQKWIQDKIL
jgi:hypothetical protein